MNETEKCIVEKRFLFWKYRVVEHDYKMHSIEKFMYCSTTFIVTYRCSKCGTPKVKKFVTHDELILDGISTELLNKIGTSPHYLNEQSV